LTLVVGRREQIATRIVFFVSGFGMSAWAPLVPFAQQRAAIAEDTLGLLLLCLGCGSIATMSQAGALAARFGCRRIIMAAAVPLCVALPLLAVVSSPIPLAVCLLVLGGSLGAIDVTMNLQAIVVERASRRAMMSGFHGLFSLGGIAGAGCVTAIMGAGIAPLGATLCVAVVILAALIMAYPHVPADRSPGSGVVFAVPHGIVLLIGAYCFVAFLTEGAMLDWSAVYLTSVNRMDPAYAGLGYATFAAAMTAGRLTGDRFVQRFGGRVVIVSGGLCAASGFALATLAASWLSSLLGFALIGVGCANTVPALYTRVGRQSVMPEHIAVAAITTLGYTGILAGPAVIGFAAHATSLPSAFLILLVLQLGVAAGGRLLSLTGG
jgi:predicted MFS family arabinose efflux permease